MKNNKFHMHKSLERLVNYKARKKNVKRKFIRYAILGLLLAGAVYTCAKQNQKYKVRGELYDQKEMFMIESKMEEN